MEANNVSPWKVIPAVCVDYVQEYMTGRGYLVDLERVSMYAGLFAKSVQLSDDGKDVWVFYVDETLLSILLYSPHSIGFRRSVEFDKWVQKAVAPPIKSSLKLYEEVLKLGFKIVLLIGRS
ncbi:Acid phosphatase, class B-like [Dillenia turbinata]|uniref:Acid phosphatase, class B-like n=1 Tax=Dillenia turbinata TaxID=194707 RepID=A0AAN8W629_9MAGN